MAVTGTIAAVAALGYGVYSGERAASAGKDAMHKQDKAQKDAQSAAQRQMQQNAEEFANANKKKPDLTSLLAGEQALSSGGSKSTFLSGGVDPSALKLGRTSLLGQ